MMKKLLLATLFSLASVSVFAEIQTVTLDVPTMNCATCPITVKKSLKNIDGVNKAEVSYDTKLAVVSFDDTKTNVDELIKATTNAGYPSTLKRKGQ
jgi:mercuric ion binding protein